MRTFRPRSFILSVIFPILFLFFGLTGFTQLKNPYQPIGQKERVLTLSKGKYDEFFDKDSIQQIGTALINLRTMEIVRLLDEREAGQRQENEKSSRFLSVDPLAQSFPWISPYAYAEGDVIRSIDLDGLEKVVRTFSYSVSNGETQLKVTDNVWHGTYIGYKPTNEEEKIAIGFVGSNNLPDNGTFTFFEFAPELGKANYARYEYTDAGGAQQARYFDANYIEFMYAQLDIARNKFNKKMNVVGTVANLAGAGALVKAELKGIAAEIGESVAETQNPGEIPSETTSKGVVNKHHIATNKNSVSTARGGPWTPKFKTFFDNADLDINTASENLVDVINHQGPHPQEYHQLVFDRLTDATRSLKPNTQAYKSAVINTLQEIGKEAQQPGTFINKLLTNNKQ